MWSEQHDGSCWCIFIIIGVRVARTAMQIDRCKGLVCMLSPETTVGNYYLAWPLVVWWTIYQFACRRPYMVGEHKPVWRCHEGMCLILWRGNEYSDILSKPANLYWTHMNDFPSLLVQLAPLPSGPLIAVSLLAPRLASHLGYIWFWVCREREGGGMREEMEGLTTLYNCPQRVRLAVQSWSVVLHLLNESESLDWVSWGTITGTSSYRSLHVGLLKGSDRYDFINTTPEWTPLPGYPHNMTSRLISQLADWQICKAILRYAVHYSGWLVFLAAWPTDINIMQS